MSVVDQLKSLFSGKSDETQASTSGQLSLGHPDAQATSASETLQELEDSTAQPLGAEDSISDDLEPEVAAELISVPLLGRRPVVVHQRILFTLLAISLFVLFAVAYFAVNQANKVAQQVAGTGNSLMQSQRLAKSVSQALVGSP
jgi:twitching motility protein PilJ